MKPRFDLRWLVPEETTTKRPILQWRTLYKFDDDGCSVASRWQTVPIEASTDEYLLAEKP